MTLLIALNHFLSVLREYIRFARNRKNEQTGEALAHGKQSAETLTRLNKARNARMAERNRQHANPDWLHENDGYKRQ